MLQSPNSRFMYSIWDPLPGDSYVILFCYDLFSHEVRDSSIHPLKELHRGLQVLRFFGCLEPRGMAPETGPTAAGPW